jgi:hypothetical protein
VNPGFGLHSEKFPADLNDIRRPIKKILNIAPAAGVSVRNTLQNPSLSFSISVLNFSRHHGVKSMESRAKPDDEVSVTTDNPEAPK